MLQHKRSLDTAEHKTEPQYGRNRDTTRRAHGNNFIGRGPKGRSSTTDRHLLAMSEAEDQAKGEHFLDVPVSKGAIVLELLAGKDVHATNSVRMYGVSVKHKGRSTAACRSS